MLWYSCCAALHCTRNNVHASLIFVLLSVLVACQKIYIYRIAGKFGGELNLALWRIDQPTAKLKIRQYLIRVYTCTYVRKINNGCGRSRASARARAHCRSQLFFYVHARRCKILLLLTMSLYRFFTKAGMPSRVPSLTDKESKTPTPVRTCGLSARARGRGYIAT